MVQALCCFSTSCDTCREKPRTTIASQAVWHRMEDRPKAENGKKLVEKWPKIGENNRELTPNLIFSPFLGQFCPFRAEGLFLFFGQMLPFFGFQPVFHSIPGRLTRNTTSIRAVYHVPRIVYASNLQSTYNCNCILAT